MRQPRPVVVAEFAGSDLVLIDAAGWPGERAGGPPPFVFALLITACFAAVAFAQDDGEPEFELQGSNILKYDEGDEVAIDTAAPVLFTRIAHTRFGDELLLQLVYTAWFPARRATSPS